MYTIPKIDNLNAHDLETVSLLLDKTDKQTIACNNWKEQFPYSPAVNFSMAHNNRELFIKFRVEEACTMAKITTDNGEVWTDSCVEFFIALDENGYYNFEFTCIGKALLGFRKEKPNAVHATPEIMESIRRFSTLGSDNFDERKGQNQWELTVAIPVTALFKHQVIEWSDLRATANVYKCGDNLSQPHFLSWKPINTPQPNFHIPPFFTAIRFE